MSTSIETLFPTRIYRADLAGAAVRCLVEDLERSCLAIAGDDVAGQRWCEENRYPGYTSYASLDDLPLRDPVFADLAARLDEHVAAFAKELDFDLSARALKLDSIWINVLAEGGYHTAHIHPNSVLSGTFYVAVPKGASAIKFEDPRLALMMAAPPRKARAKADNRVFVQVTPKPATLLLWESWLRHEVLPHAARAPRISVSFNYR